MKRFMDFFEDREKLLRFIRENRNLLIKAAAAFVLVVAAFLFFGSGEEKQENVKIEENITASEETAPKSKVYVDIGGEVRSPMVAELDEGSRVEDAIEAAGGLTENADVAEINRAAFLEDGDKIYIPPVINDEGGDVHDDSGQAEDRAAAYSDGRVNINTADSAQLQELNGVGPATAEKIIDYREENGRFDTIEDIKNVSGIGDKTFEKFRDKIKT